MPTEEDLMTEVNLIWFSRHYNTAMLLCCVSHSDNCMGGDNNDNSNNKNIILIEHLPGTFLRAFHLILHTKRLQEVGTIVFSIL